MNLKGIDPIINWNGNFCAEGDQSLEVEQIRRFGRLWSKILGAIAVNYSLNDFQLWSDCGRQYRKAPILTDAPEQFNSFEGGISDNNGSFFLIFLRI